MNNAAFKEVTQVALNSFFQKKNYRKNEPPPTRGWKTLLCGNHQSVREALTENGGMLINRGAKISFDRMSSVWELWELTNELRRPLHIIGLELDFLFTTIHNMFSRMWWTVASFIAKQAPIRTKLINWYWCCGISTRTNNSNDSQNCLHSHQPFELWGLGLILQSAFVQDPNKTSDFATYLHHPAGKGPTLAQESF